MNTNWTSKKPINGLSHFVLLNEIKDKEKITLLLVSVLDDEISLEIPKGELMNKKNWSAGWLDCPKSKSITKAYFKYKDSKKNKEAIKKIFINDNSLFNIS